MQKMRLVAILATPLVMLFAFTVAAAWSDPTEAPPNGNVAAPINVGTTDQVKNGGLGVNSLTVFGNSLFGGSTGSNAYLNFGTIPTPSDPSTGYGIRDNAGTIEFKNNGGTWQSIQNILYSMCGGACGGGGGISGWEMKQETTYSAYTSTWYYVYCTSGKKVVSCSQTSGSGYPGAAWPLANGTGCQCYNLNDAVAACAAICVN